MPDLRSALLRPLAATLAIACLGLGVRAAGVAQLPPAAPGYDFDRDIKPILEANCVRCHGETKQKSSFRLDTRAGLLTGGEENAKVIVEGHSDNRGDDKALKKDSQDRAEAITKWLIAHGVDKKRVTAVGIGPDRPIESNETEEGRAINKRVELYLERE